MLKKEHLRVRTHADRSIEAITVRGDNYTVRKRIRTVLDIFGERVGRTRGEIEEELTAFVKGGGDLKINKGIVELAYDYATFQGADPALAHDLRSRLFAAGASHFPVGLGDRPSRDETLAKVGEEFGLAPGEVERAMFADLKEEQRLEEFKAPEERAFLQRYNLALHQGLLVHAVRLDVVLPDAAPARLRQLFRYLKFFRLLFDLDVADGSVRVRIDGPMSVLKETRSYGVRLATFLPALLLLDDFEVVADVRWKRRRYSLRITPEQGLVSHYPDKGAWVPEELVRFKERLTELLPPEVTLHEASRVFSLGGRQVYVPDLELRRGNRVAWLEIIWPWKKLKWTAYYGLFATHAPGNAFLCVSTKMASKSFQQRTTDPRLVYYRATPLAPKALAALLGPLAPPAA